MGKTQVALELAYWTKKNDPDYSIFWVPALSEATFEQAYVDIARGLNIGRSDEEDIKETVRLYLSSEAAGRWLFVIDNADDVNLFCGSSHAPTGLDRYLPQSKSGRVLFTTRLYDVASLVADEVIELHEMSLLEARTLIEKSITRRDLLEDDTSMTQLIRELTYLPLAITQAAAYLERNRVSIKRYLELLRNTEKVTAGPLGRELPDRTRYEGSRNAVATTWLVSFEQIRRSDSVAASLLSFISQVEPKAIPESLLPKLGSAEQMVNTIGTLYGYTFVSRRDEMLDMHSLVHLATRI